MRNRHIILGMTAVINVKNVLIDCCGSIGNGILSGGQGRPLVVVENKFKWIPEG